MAPTSSTIRSMFPKVVLALLLVLGTIPNLTALDQPAFSRALEAEGDWYRAIGQWKQIRFESTDPQLIASANQAIVADLWAARQWESGLAEVARLGRSPESGVPNRQDLAAWEGLFQYRLSRFPAAEYALQQANSPLYQGLLMARTGRLDEAKVLWTGLALPDPTTPLEDSRSPVLAGALSALIPGAGQIYTGHWFDGGQAAAFVGVFSLAAWGTYLYDSKVSGNYGLTIAVASVAGLFHLSNIYGATKTAEYFNQNQTNARLAALEGAVFQRPLPDLSRPSP